MQFGIFVGVFGSGFRICELKSSSLRPIVPLKLVEYEFDHNHNKITIYVIFYLLKGDCRFQKFVC